LIVAEYPAAWIQLAGETWAQALGNRDASLAPLAAWLAGELENDFSAEVLSATLRPAEPPSTIFVYRVLQVHPAVRGQRVGARLIAHALLALGRHETDAALLEALPIPSIWDPLRPHELPATCDPAGVEALARHYARLGFQPAPTLGGTWHPGAMWLSYEHRLPFHPHRSRGG
jgi:GNAT superfamily N-acetyltransferase